MRQRMSPRRAGLAVGRGARTVRVARWRLINIAGFLLGAFVAFNGITGLVDDHGHLGSRLAGLAVVAMGFAVWWGARRLAGPRPE
jgi:hypothetical protein